MGDPLDIPEEERTPVTGLPGLHDDQRAQVAQTRAAPEFVGQSEADATCQALQANLEPRVVYRDEFLGWEDDLSGARVNLFIESGTVVDARRF